MSTIQTQTIISHSKTGFDHSAFRSRTPVESAFSLSVLTITTTPEAIALGDILSLRQAMIKLLSGHDLLVSLNGGSTYPLSLSGVSDSMLLNVESREVSTITCVADVADSLNGLYFDIADVAGPVRVWMNTNAGTAPAIPTGGRLIAVTVATGAAGTAVAAAILAALNADGKFIVTASTATLTITDASPGARANISAGTSTFTGASSSGSSAVPVVYLKSLGSSEIVIALAPN